MSARYAIYFVPRADSLLWQVGCFWHGRDPWSGDTFTPPLPKDISRERYEQIVQAARGYGFHATLKPPFELATGATEQQLRADLGDFADGWAPFVAPALIVSRVGGFLALTLTEGSPEFDRLSASCVEKFDSFRVPPSELEITERRKTGLTPHQDALLMRWGYPYVMDEWRFHMTLTAALREPELSLLATHLAKLFRSVTAAPLYVDRIALFKQTARGEPFVVMDWFEFGSRAR